jgi:anti-sigma factor RsiW
MTTGNDDNSTLTDLADGTFAGPAWEAWLAAHPEQAAEVATARRVRALLADLSAVPVTLPADFEERLLERVRRDATVLDLLDLWLAGWGRVLLDFLDLIFASQQAADTTALP